MFEARHAAIERHRIFFHQFPDRIQVAEGNCRKDVMTGAALEQYRNPLRGFVTLMKDGGPTDAVEFMHVAKSMHITAGIEKSTHDLDVGLGGGPMCCRSSVAGFESVRIRAMLEQ